jgi:hypothetical protein
MRKSGSVVEKLSNRDRLPGWKHLDSASKKIVESRGPSELAFLNEDCGQSSGHRFGAGPEMKGIVERDRAAVSRPSNTGDAAHHDTTVLQNDGCDPRDISSRTPSIQLGSSV